MGNYNIGAINGIHAVYCPRSFCEAKTSAKALETPPSVAASKEL
jgi:hypothetical protein